MNTTFSKVTWIDGHRFLQLVLMGKFSKECQKDVSAQGVLTSGCLYNGRVMPL